MMHQCRWYAPVILLLAISATAHAEVSMTTVQALEDKDVVVVYSTGAELKAKILKAEDDIVVVERMSDQKVMEIPRHEIDELKGIKKTEEEPSPAYAASDDAPYDDPWSSDDYYESRYSYERETRPAELSDADKELLLKQQKKGKKILTAGAILLPAGVVFTILGNVIAVVTFNKCERQFEDDCYKKGDAAMFALGVPGGLMIPTGIVLTAVGAVKKNKAKRTLRRHGVSASVTPWLYREQKEGAPASNTFAGGLQLHMNF